MMETLRYKVIMFGVCCGVFVGSATMLFTRQGTDWISWISIGCTFPLIWYFHRQIVRHRWHYDDEGFEP